jgi:hypothetical protein
MMDKRAMKSQDFMALFFVFSAGEDWTRTGDSWYVGMQTFFQRDT